MGDTAGFPRSGRRTVPEAPPTRSHVKYELAKAFWNAEVSSSESSDSISENRLFPEEPQNRKAGRAETETDQESETQSKSGSEEDTILEREEVQGEATLRTGHLDLQVICAC